MADYDEGENEKEEEGVCEPNGVTRMRNRLLSFERCTISNRIFEVIIDRGSCENIISRSLVNTLKLPVEKYPEPYSIIWITNGEGIKVKERCRVPLSIGKYYKDEVMCDVVDMDACQLLFGRPWQFDLGTTHDGRRNVYQFSKDGRKITLLPWGFKHKTDPQRMANLLTITRSKSKLVADARAAKEIHILLVKEVLLTGAGESHGEVSSSVWELLREFQELVPDELPSELPPLRNIQHLN
ncbi:hypothetical protein MLD38_020754 [Melastoma candidum]|uniref:Uncharacterized protein n=1 Tax=Melastoma candidum TaxID=119954 RepID=A0ACB9QEW6_9MYRT|nr:hypothetical protein MLD38_020754 [Melastoma candidum]